jgi:hypothetical protein
MFLRHPRSPMLLSDTPRTIDEAELAGWTELELGCPGCRILTYISWPRIRRTSGYRLLADIKARLVCQRCGKKPDRVVLHRTVYRTPMGPPESERMAF